MYNNKNILAILLLAGSSKRYGKNYNKNLELINKKEVFLYSLEVFLQNEYIDNIVLVVKQDEKNIVKDIIYKRFNKTFSSNNVFDYFDKKIYITNGGDSRNASVLNGLNTLKSDIVLIHDGARPFIKNDYIISLLETMNDYFGATLAVTTKDTIKISDDNNIVMQTTKRENTWVIQTPQCFDYNVLMECYKKASSFDSITDDCMLLEKENYEIKIVKSDYTNFKITTPDDLHIANNFANLI